MGKRPKLDRTPPVVDAIAASRDQSVTVPMAPGPLLSMDSAPSAMEVESPAAATAANASLNPVGMQIYWNLSSLDMAVREAAALALVRELRAKQDEFAAGGGRGGVAEVLGAKENDEMLEGCAPAVQYALRRLVRGLGSSRECARQGFATAFTAVVGALPVLRGETLLRIIPLNLEVTSSMKKQDARDGLLGRLFAYGSLVRAKRLIGNGTSSEEKELAKEIVEQLFTLAKQKTFLREPAANLVIELASRLPSSAVRETVCAAPLFDEWLRRDVENQSPEALLLALHLYDKLPAQSSPLLPESGNLQDLFEPSHLAKLVPCLKESSSSHPRVHSVWHLLFDLLLSPPVSIIQESAKKKRANSGNSKDAARDIKKIEENLATFWSIAVDGALLSSSHERKNLAMELLLLVLPRLPNLECVGIVLSNVLVRCILDILSSKDSHLHKSAQRCLSELRLWAESTNLRRAAVIVGLQKNSYGKFDTLSKTVTVKALTMGLRTEDGVLAFIHNLEELFVAPESAVAKVVSEEGPEDALTNGHDKKPGSNDRIWIVEQMCALCRQVKLEPKTAQASLYRAVIQFLVTHSAFDSSKQQSSGVAEKKGSKWPQKPVAVNIRKLCVERLHSILVDAEQFVFLEKSKSNKAGASEAVTDDEDFSLFAALCCLKLQKSADAALAQPLKEETAESVKILQQAVPTLSSAVKSETNIDRIRRILALRTLLSHLLLESFLEPGSTDDIAAELVICCSKAFPDLSELSKIAPSVEHDESDEVPPVIDVLLDVLLSLLAKGSTPVRLAAEKVFKVYCEDLTSAGMTDVLRIINNGSKSGRHKSMLEDGEDDEDDDDDILEEDEDEEVVDDVGKTEEKQGAKVEREDADDEDDDEDDDDDDEDDEDGEDVEMGDGESRSLQQQMRFKRPGEDLDDEAEGSDSDVSDMDDEAMFRADVLLANVLKHRKEASKSNSQTELAHFKFRVLSLLEYFLQKHPGSSLVLIAVQGLVTAFVSAINQLGTAPEENDVLVKRLETMLQSKVLKVKKYPREKDVDSALTRKLLMQTWKLASRSSQKRVRKLAQGCTLWTLKVLLGNEEKGDDELEFFASSLDDYFTHKKSRLPGPFLSEVFQRHPMLGRFAFGRLISRCGDGRTEFMKCEAMRLISGILKPLSPGKGKKSGALEEQLAKTFEEHMASLGAAILSAAQTPPQKSDYKVLTLLFCTSCIDAFTALYPQRPLHTLLDTGALLAGLKAVEAPSEGKLHKLLTKLVGTVAAELEKNPVSSETGNEDTKTTTTASKKKSESPSKRKKAAREEVEGTPSKKQHKKVKVPKDTSS